MSEEEMAYLYVGGVDPLYHVVPSMVLQNRLINRRAAEEQGYEPCAVCYGWPQAERDERYSPALLAALREKTTVWVFALKEEQA